MISAAVNFFVDLLISIMKYNDNAMLSRKLM